MYGKTEILSVQIPETKHAIQLKFSPLSLRNEYKIVYWRRGNARLHGMLDLCGFNAEVEWEVAFSQQLYTSAATEIKHLSILLQDAEKMGLKP